MTLHSERQVVVVNEGQIAGHDLATGKVLWTHDWPGKSDANASNTQPHAIGDNRIFVSKGYGVGAEVEVRRNATGEWSTSEPIWPNEDSGRRVPNRKSPTSPSATVCLWTRRWRSNASIRHRQVTVKQGRFGHGQQLLVEDLLVVERKPGELALSKPRLTPSAKAPSSSPSAAAKRGTTFARRHRLLVRNDEEVACCPHDVLFSPDEYRGQSAQPRYGPKPPETIPPRQKQAAILLDDRQSSL
jgi:outer membrane protein assembly factor BamB